MFYGDLAEKGSTIHLPDSDEESFEFFVRFLYTEDCGRGRDSKNKFISVVIFPFSFSTGKLDVAHQRIIKHENFPVQI